MEEEVTTPLLPHSPLPRPRTHHHSPTTKRKEEPSRGKSTTEERTHSTGTAARGTDLHGREKKDRRKDGRKEA
jgi:hypothetical protein